MIRKYYKIVPVFGPQEIEGVFRTDDGVPYQWNSKTKTWEFNARLSRFFNGSDMGFLDSTEAEVKAFTGE